MIAARFLEEKASGLTLLELRCGCRIWLRIDGIQIERFGRQARWCGRSDSGVYHDWAKTMCGLYAEVGVSLREALHARAAERGECCPNSRRECAGCTAEAMRAGIPLSVIRGETKLTDHFSRDHIDAECGREPRDE